MKIKDMEWAESELSNYNIKVDLNKLEFSKTQSAVYYLNPCQKIIMEYYGSFIAQTQLGAYIMQEKDCGLQILERPFNYITIDRTWNNGSDAVYIEYYDTKGKRIQNKRRKYLKVYRSSKGEYINLLQRRVYLKDLPTAKRFFADEISLMLEEEKKDRQKKNKIMLTKKYIRAIKEQDFWLGRKILHLLIDKTVTLYLDDTSWKLEMICQDLGLDIRYPSNGNYVKVYL